MLARYEARKQMIQRGLRVAQHAQQQATSGMRREAGRSSRLAYVDGARALAAMYVVLHHCFQWVWGAPGSPGVSAADFWVVGWLSYGHYAVSAFIAISGFSLMLPIVRANGQLLGGALEFFKRRARRIIPTYYAAIGFTLLLDWLFIGQPSHTVWDLTLPVTLRTVITHLLLIHNFEPGGYYAINGVFWSIAIEWQIYFFFPLLVMLARRLNVPVVTLGTAVLSLLAFVAIIEFGGTAVHLLPAHWANKFAYLPGTLAQIVDYLGLFALGMLAATIAYSPRHAWPAIRQRVPWRAVIVIVALAILVLLLLTGRQLGTWGTLGLDILTALFTLSLFIAIACDTRTIAARVLGFRPLAFVGQYAYSVYLIQAPIIALLFSYFASPHIILAFHLSGIAQTAILISVALPSVLVIAYLFFLVFERPFLTKRSFANPALARA